MNSTIKSWFKKSNNNIELKSSVWELIAKTQVPGDNSNKVATTAYADAAGGGSSYTFSEGLTESGGDVKLGGTLTEDRVIQLDAWNMIFDGNGNNSVFGIGFNTGNVGQFAVYSNYNTQQASTRVQIGCSGGGRFEITPTNTIFLDRSVTKAGIEYSLDYSATYTSRSLVDKTYCDSYYTGSLTDGAPTDAEIDAIIGDTPANKGAGFKANIKDTDGTGLIYTVVSDGINWYYSAGFTQAV